MFERTRSFFRRLTGGSDRGEERRQWERFPADTDVTVRVEGEPPLTARVRDVSSGGLRLLSDRLIDRGTTVRVDLPPPNGDSATAVLACVVFTQPAGEGHFVLGCSFSTELSDADLAPLGARKVKPGDGGQRVSERLPATGQVAFARAGTAEDARPAGIHNISPTGVALLLSEELAPGTLLNLEFRSAAGQAVLTIVGCVVFLTGRGQGQWLAGCNFVRELYDEDLQALISQPG